MYDVSASNDEEEETDKSSFETGGVAGAQETKDEDFVDDSEPTMSPTLSKAGRFAINKRAREMAPLCSVYNVDCRKFGGGALAGLRIGYERKAGLCSGRTTVKYTNRSKR